MQIGQIGGIRIVFNPFFLILLVLLGLAGYLPHGLILFGIVFLHELAHTLVASAYGVQFSAIELFPFGGVASSEGFYDPDPFAEAVIALAGPLTNGVLCILAMAVAPYEVIPAQWYDYFMRANCVIGLFNLLPAFPLDGGRVLRAYLALKLGYRRATERAAFMGRVLAVALGSVGAAGVYYGFASVSLPVLAFFIYLSAGREQRMAGYVFVRYLTRKKQELDAAGVMPAEQLVAYGDVPVKDIVRHFVPKRYHVVLMINAAGAVEGVASEMEVVSSFFEQGIDTPLEAVVGQPWDFD
ncbi:MAG: M50 family metallopeptidase [Limnochordia bacterium]|jgi:stage IV sporulation protein FB